jgi:NAD(P)-dependent dehydrogenase (short-subunit alcohol dehydrogenase family)
MLVADIADPAVPELLLLTALERFGRCDVVINNAGAIEVGPIASIDIDPENTRSDDARPRGTYCAPSRRIFTSVRVNIDFAPRMRQESHRSA